MRDAEQPFLDVAGIDPHGRPAPGGEELIEQAELLAGGRDILGRLAPAGVRTLALGRGLDQALDELGRALDQGLRVVVLADGDPMHFGVGRRLAERFGPGRLRVLPAVSSMQ
ncbi:MAG: SAM-dependent methyltransferase, partial [Desulfovibrionaceae bacterium]